MKYVAIVRNEIEAEQFNPPYQIPKGVINCYQMGKGTEEDPTWYTGEVWTIKGEKVRVKASEWIIEEPNMMGRYYPIADEVFKLKYEEVK
jgi:hypothetical protein